MSADEPLAPAPTRSASPLASSLLTGMLAFLGGAAITGAVFWYHPWPAPAAAPLPASAPRPGPATALPPGTDLATLAAREQALAARLDRIELRLRDADAGARTAAGYATQAERLMIAFAARRAIERGQPLGAVETQLRMRFGEAHGDAVATIVRSAGERVTLEDLRLALDAIAPRLVTAAGRGWWDRVRLAIGDLVVLRQAGRPSPRAADRLKRARAMLAEGQVEGALAEVGHMPGVISADSWVNAAKRYVAAREALREIEAAAMVPAAAAPAPTVAAGA